MDGTEPDVDFTKWFHDLYRPNHRPYDPKEIARWRIVNSRPKAKKAANGMRKRRFYRDILL